MATRAKNLDENDISQIVELLDGWTGKLGWELLIDEIEARLYMRYTRQALHKHERIRQAYSLKKKGLSSGQKNEEKQYSSPELKIASQQIARLTGENERLKVENDNLLQQFARWAYNAHTRNLDEDFLNRELPHVDRHQTKQPTQAKLLAKKLFSKD